MIGPEAGRLGFRIAIFLILVSTALLLVQKPDSAEFVITSLTLGIGLVFAIILIILVRRSNR